MIEIDGSSGEGGGQIIRSSLALAALTQQPLRLFNIRAGRDRPGLMRQHLTAVQAIANVCDASVEGDVLKSSQLEFKPGKIQGGDYEFSVGTAGSTSLVAQTVLPALILADAPSQLRLRGGTHNPWAPPFEFLKHVYLKQLAKTGAQVEADLITHGFYPAGGGEIVFEIKPVAQLQGFELMQPMLEASPLVTAIVSQLPVNIGERECDVIRRKTGWPKDQFIVRKVTDPVGPGNVVMVELNSPHVNELFIGHGKIGVRAEQVARKVLKETRAHLSRSVPVGAYLADQLILPLGIAAANGQRGGFLTGPLSQHSQTHLDVLQAFLDICPEVDVRSDGMCEVRF